MASEPRRPIPLLLPTSFRYSRQWGKENLGAVGSIIYTECFGRRLGVTDVRKLATADLQENRFTSTELFAYVFFLWRQARHWGYLPADDDFGYWKNFDLALEKAVDILRTNDGLLPSAYRPSDEEVH